jgi:Tat protein translocase TatB subunit
MDSFFGIGLPELALIIILATIVLGPQRMRALARQLGRWTSQLQAMTRAFKEQLNSELDAAERAELKGAKEDIQNLQQQLRDLRREVVSVARDADREVQNTIRPNLEEVRQTTRPDANGPTAGANSGEEEDEEVRLPKPLEVPDDPE